MKAFAVFLDPARDGTKITKSRLLAAGSEVISKAEKTVQRTNAVGGEFDADVWQGLGLLEDDDFVGGDLFSQSAGVVDHAIRVLRNGGYGDKMGVVILVGSLAF